MGSRWLSPARGARARCRARCRRSGRPNRARWVCRRTRACGVPWRRIGGNSRRSCFRALTGKTSPVRRASFAYPAQPDAGFLARDAFSFTTGAEPRLTPPRVPDLSRVEVGAAEGYWGTNYQATFRGAIEGGSLIVLDLGGGAALDPDAPAGATSSFAATAPDDTDAWVGVGPCGGNWPGASLGASTSVALGAFDLTGAFSGWSDTVTVTLPDQAEPLPEEERPFSSTTPYRGAGHSSCNLRPAPSSAFGAAALLSLALVGVARARRKRRG